MNSNFIPFFSGTGFNVKLNSLSFIGVTSAGIVVNDANGLCSSRLLTGSDIQNNSITSDKLSFDYTTVSSSSGAQGAQGSVGDTGLKGDTGAQGSVGDTGFQGAQGVTGTQGRTGPQGAPGTPGPTGTQGRTGATGATGAVGLAPTGPQGNPGPTGTQGRTGATGAIGFNGISGFTGTQGRTGPIGTQGSQGNNGNDLTKGGSKGTTGPIGSQGMQGSQGLFGTPDLSLTQTINVRDINLSNTIYLAGVTGLGSSPNLIVDSVTGPLSYVPSTSTLSLANLNATGNSTMNQLSLSGMFYLSVCPTLINAAPLASVTELPSPYYQFYRVNISTNGYYIKLPAPSSSLAGLRLFFKVVSVPILAGGDTSEQNIYFNSTGGNVLISNDVYNDPQITSIFEMAVLNDMGGIGTYSRQIETICDGNYWHCSGISPV